MALPDGISSDPVVAAGFAHLLNGSPSPCPTSPFRTRARNARSKGNVCGLAEPRAHERRLARASELLRAGARMPP